jgi:hypothetical protein
VEGLAGPIGRVASLRAGGLRASRRPLSVGVAADEVRETQEVLDSGPAMRVEGHGVARLDACFEDSNMFVFEKRDMVCGCGGHRIESVRPLPIVGTALLAVLSPLGSKSGWKSGQAFDEVDQFIAPVAMVAGEVEEFPRLCEYRPVPRRADDCDAAAASKLKQALVAQKPQRPKHSVGVDAADGSEVSCGREPLARLRLAVGDGATNRRSDLLVERPRICRVNPCGGTSRSDCLDVRHIVLLRLAQ